MRAWRTCLALLAVAVSTGPARATISFCNQFPHAVYVAIAYPQEDDHWLSRGWQALKTGSCRVFDSALSLRTFYYRGESEPYRVNGKKAIMSWGDKGDRTFATWADDNFQYYTAETQTLRAAMKGYAKGMDIPNDNFDVVVTFHEDGGVTESGQPRITEAPDPSSKP